jgi:hypothetical protein
MQQSSELDSLDITSRVLPPRSRLYASLEPVGLGTDMVESLTSYVSRLAQEYVVPPRTLVLEQIARKSAPPNRP